MVDLSIIIISFNTKKLTLASIESVLKYTRGINYEIIVIDNASTDGSPQAIQKLKIKNPPAGEAGQIDCLKIQIIRNKKNLGFAKGNNQGATEAKGKYILFLNSDTIVADNAIAKLVLWLNSHKDVAVVTCRLENEDGSTQATGGYFPTLLTAFSWMTIQDLPFVDNFIKPFHPMKGKSFSKNESFYKEDREMDWVTGAFLLVKKDALAKAGGWDEDYFMYMEEVDLCFRIKKLGVKIMYVPKWSIIHLGGASCSAEFTVLSEYKGIKIFYKKNFPAWQYPILRLILKVGALGRIVLFGIIEGRKSAKIYAKAFKLA